RIGGLSIHDVMLLPAQKTLEFFATLGLAGRLDEATTLLLGEIRSRLGYLCEVGLGYVTLDRQSRTLSGGEVQRINLTTALGTSPPSTSPAASARTITAPGTRSAFPASKSRTIWAATRCAARTSSACAALPSTTSSTSTSISRCAVSSASPASRARASRPSS